LRLKETSHAGSAFAAASLLICFSIFAQAPSSQESLTGVEVAGLRNDKGQAVCALFSSAADFLKKGEKAAAPSTSAISDRHAVCEFHGVAPGTYAISVFHDERGHLGPPKFAAAAFQFEGGRLENKITMNYL
jgi:uncharacterized protein (DUF2141 family)